MDEGAYGFDRAALRMAFSRYNDLACFDTHSGKALWLHECEGIGRHDIALSQNGTRLAASAGAENPRVVRLYDAASGDLLRQFDRHASAVLALALSSDGRKLVTASTAGAVQLWDAATGELLKTYAYQVPSWGMSAPVLSPDNQWLAVVGAEARIGASRVGVFRVDSGELEWEIQLKTDASIGPGFPLAFAPDGTFLYTGARGLEAWPLKKF
jgi:WD40 repeat protein